MSVPNDVHACSSGSLYVGNLFIFEMYISGSLWGLRPATVIMISLSVSLKFRDLVLIEKKRLSFSEFNYF